MILSGGVTYIIILVMSKEKIRVLIEAVFPKEREQQIMRRGDCLDFQEHCHKLRVLELKNIFDKIGELTKRFDHFQKEVVQAIKEIKG